jgi:hypothetical protein
MFSLIFGANEAEELHLKRLEGVVQMRPQYHHIDAKIQVAKATSARGNESARLNEPRLIQQTARTAADGVEINIAQTSKYLTSASEEPWLRLKHKDEDVSALIPSCTCTQGESPPKRMKRTENQYSCPTQAPLRSSSPRGQTAHIWMRSARKGQTQRRCPAGRRIHRNELLRGLREKSRVGRPP